MPEVRLDGHSDNVLLDSVLMVKVGGNSILQLLQGINDLVEALCEFPTLSHSELATLRESWLLPSLTRVCLNFIHFDTQSRNLHIWIPSRRFVLTPAVYPRVLEILTTLTFGALRKNHIMSKAFEAIKKKESQKQRKPVVHVRSAMYHESSRTRPKLGKGCLRGKNRSHVNRCSTKTNRNL